jgi:hypothetical protein
MCACTPLAVRACACHGHKCLRVCVDVCMHTSLDACVPAPVSACMYCECVYSQICRRTPLDLPKSLASSLHPRPLLSPFAEHSPSKTRNLCRALWPYNVQPSGSGKPLRMLCFQVSTRPCQALSLGNFSLHQEFHFRKLLSIFTGQGG